MHVYSYISHKYFVFMEYVVNCDSITPTGLFIPVLAKISALRMVRHCSVIFSIRAEITGRKGKEFGDILIIILPTYLFGLFTFTVKPSGYSCVFKAHNLLHYIALNCKGQLTQPERCCQTWHRRQHEMQSTEQV